MTSCPRCQKVLTLHGQGLLRCAEHGLYVPESILRRRASYQVAAVLMSALSSGGSSGSRCASCASETRIATIPLPEDARASGHGCVKCGGWWFDAADIERVRASMLSRPTGATTRAVGGYGGTSRARVGGEWPLAEGLFAVLQRAGAFES